MTHSLGMLVLSGLCPSKVSLERRLQSCKGRDWGGGGTSHGLVGVEDQGKGGEEEKEEDREEEEGEEDGEEDQEKEFPSRRRKPLCCLILLTG